MLCLRLGSEEAKVSVRELHDVSVRQRKLTFCKTFRIAALSMRLGLNKRHKGDYQVFDVIDFLESVGQDAEWRHADSEALAVALTGVQIGPELRMAILARDERELQALLGQDPFCCLINPAKPDEDQEECDGSCKEGEDEDENKDKSTDDD